MSTLSWPSPSKLPRKTLVLGFMAGSGIHATFFLLLPIGLSTPEAATRNFLTLSLLYFAFSVFTTACGAFTFLVIRNRAKANNRSIAATSVAALFFYAALPISLIATEGISFSVIAAAAFFGAIGLLLQCSAVFLSLTLLTRDWAKVTASLLPFALAALRVLIAF